jgi:hypothetical protein
VDGRLPRLGSVFQEFGSRAKEKSLHTREFTLRRKTRSGDCGMIAMLFDMVNAATTQTVCARDHARLGAITPQKARDSREYCNRNPDPTQTGKSLSARIAYHAAYRVGVCMALF